MTSPEDGTHSNAYVIYEFERRAYAVSETPVRIGRDASNDIILRESAVSRFNSEIRREDGRCVLHSIGSTPATVDGDPVTEPHALSEGTRIEIGSAILTFTEKRLPIGVSVVERAKKGGVRNGVRDDVGNRRVTIKHPLLKTSSAEPPPDPHRRSKILLGIALVVLVLYLFGR